MTHFELTDAGLHNTHIKFALNGEILSGVIVDDIYHTEGKTKRTDYSFIPTANMIDWKKAESLNDKMKMNALSSVVDIDQITWGVSV